MFEMARAGCCHCHCIFITKIDTFLVAHRAAGVNNRRDPRTVRNRDTVGEREKRIARHYRACKVKTERFCFLNSVLQSIYTRSLTAAHADELPIAHQCDSV